MRRRFRYLRFRSSTRVSCLAAIVFALCFSSCRESVSENPPVHLNRNMDTQEKHKPQRESRFFADGAAMRTPVEHTVARDGLSAGNALFTGKQPDGSYSGMPFEITPELRSRGAERYAIYCRPCHGDLGNGRGKILEYKFPIPPTSYFDPRILRMPDGQLFEVISDGIRNMASYRAQIAARDRWCIVAYVRRLQMADLPDSLRNVPSQQAGAIK